MSTRLERQLPSIMWGLATLAVILTVLVLAAYALFFNGPLAYDQAVWAYFGNYVGGLLGPLLALVALVALLLTLRVQSIELRESVNALTEQNRSLRLQNFENKFFQMLSLHHQIVSGMDLRADSQVVAIGRDCLRTFYRRLKQALRSVARGDYLDHKEGVRTVYEKFYRQNAHELSHYFRHIYRVLKFVHESDVEDKKGYTGILRAQLSNAELALLFYNGITDHGEKLKPLAEEYALFENFEIRMLMNSKKDWGLYEERAFGDQADYLRSRG